MIPSLLSFGYRMQALTIGHSCRFRNTSLTVWLNMNVKVQYRENCEVSLVTIPDLGGGSKAKDITRGAQAARKSARLSSLLQGCHGHDMPIVVLQVSISFMRNYSTTLVVGVRPGNDRLRHAQTFYRLI